MTSHDELFDSIAAYALGVLPPAEAQAVEAHLQSCERCRDEYRALRPAVTAVAYSAEACADASTGAVVASPLLKSRIMKHVRAEAAAQPKRGADVASPPTPSAWPVYALAAACLALAIVTGLTNLSLNRRLNRDLAETAAQTQTIADLTAPGAQRYSFAGGEVVTNDDRIYIAMRNLPEPPPGRVYQAWTLARGAKSVAPSRIFMPRSGTTVVPLPETAGRTAAVAVSVEPMGGSKQPTTKPIAVVRI
jgi:anti-sigma-K factor RskA